MSTCAGEPCTCRTRPTSGRHSCPSRLSNCWKSDADATHRDSSTPNTSCRDRARHGLCQVVPWSRLAPLGLAGAGGESPTMGTIRSALRASVGAKHQRCPCGPLRGSSAPEKRDQSGGGGGPWVAAGVWSIAIARRSTGQCTASRKRERAACFASWQLVPHQAVRAAI